MKTTLLRSMAFFCAVTATLLPLPTSAALTTPAAEKMKAEDVLAKHLESIGPATALSDEKSRVIVGTARAAFRARNTSGSIEGRTVVASIKRKVLLGMAFTAPNYPGEKFGFDAKKLTIGYLRPGIRSTLGNFIEQHSDIVKEGLMGGTLTTAWPLLNIQERGGKLEYSGTDKVNDQLAHKLVYSPKKGSELKITLYFDAKSFEHVKTQYERVISTRLSAGGIDSQARQQETRYKLTENFSGYKKEGDLNLPHQYTLQLEVTKTNGSSTEKWETEFTDFHFNEAIDEAGFNVEAN